MERVDTQNKKYKLIQPIDNNTIGIDIRDVASIATSYLSSKKTFYKFKGNKVIIYPDKRVTYIHDNIFVIDLSVLSDVEIILKDGRIKNITNINGHYVSSKLKPVDDEARKRAKEENALRNALIKCASLCIAGSIIFNVASKKLNNDNEKELENKEKIENYSTINNKNEKFTLAYDDDIETINKKISFIQKNYNLTSQEFWEIAYTVLAEAKNNSYDDAYGVINTIYNRTIDTRWNEYISSLVAGENSGNSLYSQVIAPTQFEGYKSNAYYEYVHMDKNTIVYLPGFCAIIDFLYNNGLGYPDCKYPYMSFMSDYYVFPEEFEFRLGYNAERIVIGGNQYFDPMTLDELSEGYEKTACYYETESSTIILPNQNNNELVRSRGMN